MLYVGVGAIPLLMLGLFLVYQVRHEEIPAMPVGMDRQAATTIQPGLAVAPVSSVPASTNLQADGVAQSKAASKRATQQATESKETKAKPRVKRPAGQTKTKTPAPAVSKSGVAVPTGGTDAFLSVRCIEGAEVFLDGTRKGRISGSSITIKATPGPHTVIVSHARGVDSRNVVIEAGKTVHIDPDFCN
ncbi:MAG: hypothetical protein A3K04_04655 [Gallionellales bacterium RBG_16_56_9]|nr:MAG: hypothetical protein A3K04_04655 [Gallionellales bacterium RBG_16_56_9]